jgi:hypothetical protein
MQQARDRPLRRLSAGVAAALNAPALRLVRRASPQPLRLALFACLPHALPMTQPPPPHSAPQPPHLRDAGVADVSWREADGEYARCVLYVLRRSPPL